MAADFLVLNEEGAPKAKLLSDPCALAALACDAEVFERLNEINATRETDEQGAVTFVDLEIQFAWEAWQKSAAMWAEQTHALFNAMALTQARLVEDGAAFASNLRGSNTTTGAVYSHLVAQRDAFARQLEQAKAQGFKVDDLP